MRKTFFSRLLLGILLPALVLAGFGCKQPDAAPRPVVLEYWTVFDDVDALQKLIAQYTVDRPYITVRVKQLRAEEFYPRLLEALAEDKGPDIISVRSRSIGGLESKLAPMPARVPDTLIRTEKGTVKTETRVIAQAKNLVTVDQLDREYVQAVKKDVVRNGKIYGLPLSFDTLAIYYNKDLLDRAGVAELPKSWEQFSAAVKKITKYDKNSGTILQSGAAFGAGGNVPGSDDLLYVLFKQSNVTFVNRDGQAVFNISSARDDGGGAAMRLMDFYTDFANPTRDTYAWNEAMESALDRFAKGSVGFFFGYNYHYPLIKARAPQLNFGILPLFQLDAENPMNAANYWVQSVTAKSKHQNEAWGLIDYLTHSAATKDYLDITGRPTALRVYIKSQSEKAELQPFVLQALVAENWYHGKNYEAAQKAINDMVHEWLGTPPDPNRALEWKQDVLNRGAAKINQTF